MPALIGKFPSMLRMPCGQMELRDLISGCQSGGSRDPLAVALAKRVAAASVRGLQRRAPAFPRRPHREHLATGALLVEDEPRALAVEPQVFNDATWSLNCDARVRSETRG